MRETYVSNLVSFRVKTELKHSFTRITGNRVTRSREMGFPRFKMQKLAFCDLKYNEGNLCFEFGVVSSYNDKVIAILRFPTKGRNSRERKPRKGRNMSMAAFIVS